MQRNDRYHFYHLQTSIYKVFDVSQAVFVNMLACFRNHLYFNRAVRAEIAGISIT